MGQTKPIVCLAGQSHIMSFYFEICGQLGIDIGLISIDQEKAFDKVEHPYLGKTLEAFGFNHHFIDKIKVLYRDI